MTFRKVTWAAGCLMLAVCSQAAAYVSLDMRLDNVGVIQPGDAVNVGVYAVTDDVSGVEPMCCMDVVFAWENTSLQFTGINQNGPYAWLELFIPTQVSVNEADPPADGDAYFTAWGQFPPHPLPEATANGLLVATLEFVAIGSDCRTAVCLLDSVIVSNQQGFISTLHTEVLGTEFPGQIITGDLTNDIFYVGDESCYPMSGDLDCDGDVDNTDLGIFKTLIWQSTQGGVDTPACCFPPVVYRGDGGTTVGGLDEDDFNSLVEVVVLNDLR